MTFLMTTLRLTKFRDPGILHRILKAFQLEPDKKTITTLPYIYLEEL